MTSPDPQKVPRHFGEIVSNPGTPSELPSGPSGGLLIPISDDSGFYGYGDEKYLQHVSISTHTLALTLTGSSSQMGEKLFVQRRGSTHSDGGKSVFKSGLAMTSVTPDVEPKIPSRANSPFVKEEDLKPEADAGPGPHPTPGSSGGFTYSREHR